MGKNAKRRRESKGTGARRTLNVQLSLPLVDALTGLEEDFFALCVRSGQAVLSAMLEEDRTALCGPKWTRSAKGAAQRAGTTHSAVTLGGRRIPITRPRARRRGGEEIDLPTFVWARRRDPLDRATLNAVSAGVSTRAYETTLPELPDDIDSRATARSSVSRRFVAMSSAKLTEWLNAPLEAAEFEAIAIDAIYFKKHCVVIALGLTAQGTKRILGLHEGSTENAAVVQALLTNLVERGLDASRPMLFAIDGSKALRKAIREVWGETGVVQRCQIHKIRNVLEHLPEDARPRVRAEMCKAYEESDWKQAEARLKRLARSLAEAHPGAAASVCEGLAETLTLQRLGVRGALYRTLRSTNTIENLNGTIATYTRNTKRWRGGRMILRWVAAALDHAQPRFRAIRGFSELPKLRTALVAMLASGDQIGEELAA
jgi:putative transposase